MNESSENIYDESSIVSLGMVNGVRARPSMYVDGLSHIGILKLIQEGLQNSTDEISAGRATQAILTINSQTKTISIYDDGAGIPIDKIKDIILTPHSGGKLDDIVKGYEFSSGTNGMGLFLTNCLSDYMKVEVYRDNLHAIGEFEKGFLKSWKKEKTDLNIHSTLVTFNPSMDIFFNEKHGHIYEGLFYDKNLILSTVDILAHTNPGSKYILDLDGKKYTFIFTGGLQEYLQEFLHKEHKHSLINNPFIFTHKDTTLGMQISVALTFNKDGGEKYLSCMNNFPTIKNGTHVTGCRQAISRIITNYLKNNDYIPKTAKFTVSGADIIDNLCGIIMGTSNHTLQWTNQTKEELTSVSVGNFISSAINTAFTTWVNNNKDDMDKICKLAVLKAKANAAAKEARQLAMDPTSTKNMVQSKVDLKKFTDCSGNNPKENELFLIEGDSAGGSTNQARDSRTQAFLRLRGKILNVINKKGTLSPELEAIVTILGMGFGNKKNYAKLKYHTIIIMCDADPDGGHIASLCIAFFYTYYPELILNGHIYVAMPPLYQLTFKNKQKIFILNEEYLTLFKRNAALKMFNLIDKKGQILSEKVFSLFLSKLIRFNEFLMIYSIELNVDPVLLELIVRSFDNLIKGDYTQFTKFGYMVKLKEKNNKMYIFEFDKDYLHSYLHIDHKFYKDFYTPIYLRMCEIGLGNLQLQAKSDISRIYYGTFYELANIIDSILINKNVRVTKIKGLGEQNAEDLWSTAMNPKTRKITKVTMDNAKEAEKWLHTLLGTGNMQEKKAIFLQ